MWYPVSGRRQSFTIFNLCSVATEKLVHWARVHASATNTYISEERALTNIMRLQATGKELLGKSYWLFIFQQRKIKLVLLPQQPFPWWYRIQTWQEYPNLVDDLLNICMAFSISREAACVWWERQRERYVCMYMYSRSVTWNSVEYLFVRKEPLRTSCGCSTRALFLSLYSSYRTKTVCTYCIVIEWHHYILQVYVLLQ